MFANRSVIAALLAVVLAAPAGAEPNWFVRHKHTITLFAVNGAAIGVSAAGLAHCRRGDVENCTGHYGAAWATFGIWAGVTGVVMPTLAVKCWRDGAPNGLCYTIGYTGAAYQTAWGINEWHQYGPEPEASSCQLKVHPLWMQAGTFKVAPCQ